VDNHAVRPSQQRRLPGAIAAACASASALALALSPSADAAPACVPSGLDIPADLAGGTVTVSPAPGTVVASPFSQISFRGAPATEISGVKVKGSSSGTHAGRLLAYSQGDGASFVPAKPFAPGEQVSVQALLTAGGSATPFSWRFKTAVPDTVSRSLETPPPPPPPPRRNEFQHFHSRPGFRPPSVTVTVDSGAQAPGDLFLAPYAGPGQYGPMILDARGSLLWFRRIPAGERAADLRVQEYEGRPVLTWWQAPLVFGGRRDAGIVIADASYRDVQIVRAGNGYQPDLHAFAITPQGTALFTVYAAIRCNLSRYGGPAQGAIADTLVQEIDLRTGLVRFEWHSLDHVAPQESYMPVHPTGTVTAPWDYFHINAVEPEPTGEMLVDARNTWAAYDVDRRAGRVIWRVGGKRSSFAMGPGSSPAWQHDARLHADGTITFFDNGGTPRVHPQSRGIVLALDTTSMSANLLSSFVYPTPLLAPSQGNFQALPSGWLAGWGQEPFVSEYSTQGRLLFAAHLPPKYQSLTVLKYAWSGTPASAPAIAIRERSKGALVAYVSWNGATAVASWRVLSGTSPRSLRPVATVARSGFETAVALAHASRYLAAQALDSGGSVLATSASIRRQG
jgi:hypothetical protein